VARVGASSAARKLSVGWSQMSPTLFWTQVAIVVFVAIGMIIAITKLV
jgi:hypothetical protein